ncbi:nucleoside phosphorylase-I family protein [Candidatus Methylacidithermus pantelleriae]|uniref:Putative Nucleoside phosphorylase n=1 Tax=Candidatus Methylacidithermus pantelleriae TaxID=2744239 RepID=A0A8J2FPQ7_9BACT|nr:hypothetical protein [Candidatus Methylacidithermus pantelleriae]CAF0704522.1 putative Nucleoside phosphorylase [Candidatus Methylacidithermus pantelleriae]
MIGVLFPLEHEAGEFLRKVKALPNRHSRLILWQVPSSAFPVPLWVGILGMGKQCQASARDFFASFHPSTTILAGYAGALVRGLNVGELYAVENFSTFLPPDPVLKACGIKLARGTMADDIIATPQAREALAHSSGAEVVDMESQLVWEEAQQAGCKLCVLRVVSDPFERVLPVKALYKAFGKRGASELERAITLAAHFGRNPSEFLPFLGFVRDLMRARRALTRGLMALIGSLAPALACQVAANETSS